jgi:hypothetical protein
MNEADHDLLMRIDERTESMCSKIDEMNARMDREFVTQAEYWPVKTIVYTGAGVALLAVITALVALVVRGTT